MKTGENSYSSGSSSSDDRTSPQNKWQQPSSSDPPEFIKGEPKPVDDEVDNFQSIEPEDVFNEEIEMKFTEDSIRYKESCVLYIK